MSKIEFDARDEEANSYVSKFERMHVRESGKVVQVFVAKCLRREPRTFPVERVGSDSDCFEEVQ